MALDRPTEINHDLVNWVKENLPRTPSDENYYKMICGVDYNAMTKESIMDRITSTEKSADYAQLRLSNYDSLDKYFESRSKYISEVFGSTGKSPYVEAPFFVDYGYNIKVGDNFYANFNTTFLDCSIIDIGNDVMFGPNVTLATASHPSEAEYRSSGVEFAKPIKIGNGVWIGSNAVVLPGVTIGDNAVIAAGAVVSRDVPESTVAAGVPARVVKKIVQVGDKEDAAKANGVVNNLVNGNA